VAEQLPRTFGELLRRLRIEAGLSQEALGERAVLTARAIRNLEQGVIKTAPRAANVAQLADALRLDEAGKRWLLAASRGEPVPSTPPVMSAIAPLYTLPRNIGSFVGRSRDLAHLTQDADRDDAVTIHVISGMGGVGKTALAVRAAHELAPRFPDGQIFLRLSGHTLEDQPIKPKDALASLLLAARAGGEQIAVGLDELAMRWRGWLAGKRVLLLLDDAVDSRQVRPLLPGTGGCIVLITSRGKLTALKDTRRIDLGVLTTDESTDLLAKLGDRPGVDRADSAIEEIARLCGNLPLALGMLGSQLHSNPAWTPAGLASELIQAGDLPEEIHDGQETVGAVLDLSYRDLTEDQQRMFRRLGLHPGADVDDWTAAALGDISPAEARRHLRALCEQNIITEPSYRRYRFHDLIRALARNRAIAEDPAEVRDAAVVRLLDYYLHTAAAASRHLARRTATREPGATRPQPPHVRDMPDRQDAISWMAAERLNLAAATDYAAANGYLSHAVGLPASMHGFLRSEGYWDQALKLHRIAQAAAEQDRDLLGEAGALTDLGDVQYLKGDHAHAEISLTRAVDLARRLGDQRAEAGALVEFGVLQANTGDLAGAEASLTRALGQSGSEGDRLGEANALTNLGVAQYVAGNFTAAADSQQLALAIYRDLGDQVGQASALNGLGGVQQATGANAEAVGSFRRAMELYRSLGDRIGEAYATGNLGAVQGIMGDWAGAFGNLGKALERYRELGRPIGEADMLTNLGAVHRMTGDFASAETSLTRAVKLYRDLKDPFGEAGALSELGVVRHRAGAYRAGAASLARAVKLAHDAGERASEAEALNNLGDLYVDAARDAYTRALDIAANIGLPLEEARAMEGLGRLLLQSGERAAGIGMLKRSLALYKQIGSAFADRVARIIES
jgi:tetratricopeptide (TPR) repeat protein/transcriptional regulator with XRE-family HTH domain